MGSLTGDDPPTCWCRVTIRDCEISGTPETSVAFPHARQLGKGEDEIIQDGNNFQPDELIAQRPFSSTCYAEPATPRTILRGR
jgi:hypothetical protein